MKTDKVINMCGIQLGAAPVDTAGNFREFGTVYYSELSSANILSLASQVNAGADIDYDKVLDRFTLTPAHSSNTYVFGRKDASGSEGRFYVCNLREMVTRNSEHVCVKIVSENRSSSERLAEQARAARDMLVTCIVPLQVHSASSASLVCHMDAW
jgi:hypothetical protein